MIDEIVKEVLGELADGLIYELGNEERTKDSEVIISEYLQSAFNYGKENTTK